MGAADINAEIRLPSGEVIRWDSEAPDAGNRPLSPSFDTESGRGFSSGSVVLRKPTERFYPELGLLNELTLRSGTGRIVYQGRAQGIPSSDQFSLDCDGWMSHGEQREITDFIIDRDASAWGSITTARKVINANIPQEADYTVETKTGSIIFTGSSGKVIPANSQSETAYRAPAGATIAAMVYNGSRTNTTSVATPTVSATDKDQFSNSTTSNLTLDSTARTVNFTGSPKALILTVKASAQHTPPAAAPFNQTLTAAVYGQHGVPIANRDDGLTGFTASDAIRYIANRYCPKWNTSGIEATSYLIPHAVWREPTTPADAIRQLNSYHLWKLGVWEDRRLEFAPYDLSVADWQVASGVDGARVEYQGDTTENLYNGAAVSFTDIVTNEQKRLTPDQASGLKDDAEWIAANQWGDQAWLNIDISWPVTSADAVEIGAVALANANQARRPSTITLPAYVKDIHGHKWPSSYVRADQTILVTNQHTPVPRLITKTSWSDHSLTITTDNAIDTMEAFNQRVSGALSARGLI